MCMYFCPFLKTILEITAVTRILEVQLLPLKTRYKYRTFKKHIGIPFC
jgi:hypothetical protein